MHDDVGPQGADHVGQTISVGNVHSPGLARLEVLDPARFLEASGEKKDVFVCKSTEGCGGAGNKCRIDRLSTFVEGERQKFTWGGGCSLYVSHCTR